MKFLLIALVIAQVSCAPSTLTDVSAFENQRGLMQIWDFISPWAQPVAIGVDAALQTLSNAHQAVTGAISNAHQAVTGVISGAHGAVTGAIQNGIHSATQFLGSLIPPLGKRDVSIDARFDLLAQLQSFQTGFQQSIHEAIQAFLSGSLFTSINNIVPEFKKLLTKVYTFLQTHVAGIMQAINAVAAEAKDNQTIKALLDCTNAVQIIQQATQAIRGLFSS